MKLGHQIGFGTMDLAKLKIKNCSFNRGDAVLRRCAEIEESRTRMHRILN